MPDSMSTPHCTVVIYSTKKSTHLYSSYRETHESTQYLLQNDLFQTYMYIVDGMNVASGYHTITTLHTTVTVNFNTSS